MDKPQLPNKKLKGDDNVVRMLLVVEFIAMGFIGFWSSKDVTTGNGVSYMGYIIE